MQYVRKILKLGSCSNGPFMSLPRLTMVRDTVLDTVMVTDILTFTHRTAALVLAFTFPRAIGVMVVVGFVAN